MSSTPGFEPPVKSGWDSDRAKHRRNWRAVSSYISSKFVTAGQLADDAVTSDAIAPGAVNDESIESVSATKITQGTLNAIVTLQGSISPAAIGQRPVYDANGFRFIDSTGATVINFPTGEGAPAIKANIDATGLTISGKLILRDDGTAEGHTLDGGATLTISGATTGSAVSDPSSPPIVSQDWETITMGTVTNRVGLFWDTVNTSFWTAEGSFIYEHDADGTLIRSSQINGVSTMLGVVRVGSYVYVLYRDTDSDLIIKSLAQSTLVYDSQVNVENKTGVISYGLPGLGFDGTDLIVADFNDPGSVGVLRFHKFTTANKPVFVSTTTSSGTGNPTHVGASSTCFGFSTGESAWWVATTNGFVYKFNTSGVYQQNNEFPGFGSGIPRGVAHDGTRFWTGMSDERICKHSSWVWTTESERYWVAYTWVDDNGAANAGSRPLGAGDYETKKSPTAQIALARRGRLNITVSSFPSTVTHAGIYMDRGAAEPTLDYVADTATVNTSRDNFSAGGAAPPGTNTFPAVISTPADVKSADTGFQVYGDGTGEWRHVMPPGAVLPYAGSTAPNAGWLLCDGAAVSRTTYATLFAVLNAAGLPYGVGDGSTTFNLPDLRQRFPLGKAASGTGSTLGGTGGAIDHTHSFSDSSHSHSVSGWSNADGSHTHDSHNVASNTQTGGGADRLTNPVFHSNPGNHQHVISLSTGSGGGGGGSTGSNNPPYQVLNYIIKT